MKAAVVTDVNKIEILDIPIPQPGPYQALVKVLACGFCNGTDTKIVEGRPFSFSIYFRPRDSC